MTEQLTTRVKDARKYHVRQALLITNRFFNDTALPRKAFDQIVQYLGELDSPDAQNLEASAKASVDLETQVSFKPTSIVEFRENPLSLWLPDPFLLALSLLLHWVQ